MASVWVKDYDSSSRVATLTLDLGPEHKQNVLTQQALEELSQRMEEFFQNPPAALIITSAKKESFCAGGDISQIQGLLGEEGSRQFKALVKDAHQLLTKIYSAPFPIVAAISGECLGGGLEIALLCHGRVAAQTSKTRFGLPETKLGLIPGFGGTQLLPRTVGLIKAIEIIVGQRTLTPKEALAAGLVDAISEPENLLAEAQKLAFALNVKSGRRKVGIEKIPWLGPKLILKEARKRVLAENRGNYPALFYALSALEASYLPLPKGLAQEGKLFVRCLKSPEARNLIELFFIRQEARSKDWVEAEVPPRPPTRVGVLGAGVMGRGIAYALASSGIPVLLYDLYPQAVAGAVKYVEGLLGKGIKRGKITAKEARRRKELLSVSWGQNLEGFRQVDFLIEAVLEDLAVKHQILTTLGNYVKPGITVATNTSSLLPSEIAKSWKEPENFCAMHFFNPVPLMDLVEIAGHSQTSTKAMAEAVELTRAMGKTPVVLAHECPGLVVNRIFPHYGTYPMVEVVQNGVHPKVLDKAFERFGMFMGPFKTLDLVGFDTAEKVFGVLSRSYPGSLPDLSALGTLVSDKKMLGQKTGRGFYIWKKDKAVEFNSEILSHLGLAGSVSERKTDQVQVEKIVSATLERMYLEASKVVEEGICSPEMVDLLLILGVGFAPNRRGIFGWAREQGLFQDLARAEPKFVTR